MNDLERLKNLIGNPMDYYVCYLMKKINCLCKEGECDGN